MKERASTKLAGGRDPRDTKGKQGAEGDAAEWGSRGLGSLCTEDERRVALAATGDGDFRPSLEL